MLKKLSRFIAICLVIFLVTIIFLKFSGFYQKIFYPIKYENYVVEYSDKYDMDKYLIYSVIKTESNFDEKAVSNVGARGLMQLMEEAYDWVKYRMGDDRNITYDEMFNAEYNIEYGTYMLMLLRSEYGNDETAIAAYHAGRSAVNGWLKNSEYSSDGKTLTKIPSKSTAHYVSKVIKAYEGYKNLYN